MPLVRTDNLIDGIEVDARRPARRVQTGVVSSARVSLALVYLIRVTAVLLIVFSVLGTFYGSRDQNVPLTQPTILFATLAANMGGLLIAATLQGVLSVVQWGSMGFAKTDPRWWLLYAAALGLSAYWNWQAYGDTIIAIGVPWLLAYGIILAADVLAEKALVL